MGSLENGFPLKRDPNLLRGSNLRRNSSFLGSRFARLVLFKKIDYLQLICSLGVFFFFVFFFQIFFLPGSVREDGDDKSSRFHHFLGKNGGLNPLELSFLKELDFGEDVKFEPLKILEKFQKDVILVNGTVGAKRVLRFGYRKPKIALIFADLRVDQHQILMVTVATALLDIGYEIEVFSLDNSPAHAVWGEVGVPVSVIKADGDMKFSVDWLNYDGILVNSLHTVGFITSLMQEPFKNVPLVWTIHEQTLSNRLRQYVSSGQTELINSWRKVFARATVVVFPNHILPMAYSECDPGNYYVIPGSPEEAWKTDKQVVTTKDDHSFVVVVVGSQLGYQGQWLEHGFVLRALHPLVKEFSNSGSQLKIIVLAGDSARNYSRIVEIIVQKLGYQNETVKHVVVDENTDSIISTADIVIYGSFLEEHSFPGILLKAMCFGKPVIAPDLLMIRKYVSDRVNGFLFPKDDITVLTKVASQMVSNGKLSLLASNAASIGKRTAKNLMVSESVEGYTFLLEKIIAYPSEVAIPISAGDIPLKLKDEWRWRLFEAIDDDNLPRNETMEELLDKVEKRFNRSNVESSVSLSLTNETTLLHAIWEEQKKIDYIAVRKRREDEELKERTEQTRAIWNEVYRSARRADRVLHERDEGELERTGQPLCIYEPYFGVGTWPFLHRTSLYRGLGLSTKGRRPGTDDIDAPARLPLLSNPYYRDVLGEYGAYFAIANRIDSVHKNAWIGFQSWRTTANKKSLSKIAERSLLDAIEAQKHGDALYFWVRLDTDPRNPSKQDFWEFCDAINAGNCQSAFLDALKRMYGITHELNALPPMPSNEGTWSVMHSWALPTKSFVEFVMFSRMFVDALDSQFYDQHQKTGRCYLSLSKDKHCYSRLLELLINVWAYHGARRMVYIDPNTGFMQEQHGLKTRRGTMWIKWFQFDTLKSMDEDLAEESDSDHPKRLWPSTGEVFWQGIYEKERNMRNKEKEKKRQHNKDKIERIRKRARHKVLGKYVKPRGDDDKTNTTDVA